MTKKTEKKKNAKQAVKKPAVKKSAPAKQTVKSAAKPVAKKNIEAKIAAPAAKKPAAKKSAPEKKAKAAIAANAKISPDKAVAKKTPPAKKTAEPAAKPAAKKPTAVKTPAQAKQSVKPAQTAQTPPPKPPRKPAGPESLLLVPGTKFTRTPFIFDAFEKDDKDSRRKHGTVPKQTEKPTASSRPRIGDVGEGLDLVAVLSQQLEDENRNFFSGCEGKMCDRCNSNEVDPKFYVNESLGYCLECATILGLGQSKEGVFSEAQMDLMRRTMESSGEDIDEDNIESVLENMELDEEALLGESEE